jgi:hypothetical protein
MKRHKVQEEKIKRAIRDAVVIDPLISTAKLQDALFEKGFKTYLNTPLDWMYLHRLREKIHRQTIEKVNHQKVAERVAEMKERYRLTYEQLIRIAFYSEELRKEGVPPTTTRDRIQAFKEIIKLDLAIFGAEMDSGIFDRHLGVLELEQRNKPIPVEAREGIRQALINWGMIPKELPAPHIENEDANQQQPTVPRQ